MRVSVSQCCGDVVAPRSVRKCEHEASSYKYISIVRPHYLVIVVLCTGSTSAVLCYMLLYSYSTVITVCYAMLCCYVYIYILCLLSQYIYNIYMSNGNI